MGTRFKLKNITKKMQVRMKNFIKTSEVTKLNKQETEVLSKLRTKISQIGEKIKQLSVNDIEFDISVRDVKKKNTETYPQFISEYNAPILNLDMLDKVYLKMSESKNGLNTTREGRIKRGERYIYIADKLIDQCFTDELEKYKKEIQKEAQYKKGVDLVESNELIKAIDQINERLQNRTNSNLNDKKSNDVLAIMLKDSIKNINKTKRKKYNEIIHDKSVQASAETHLKKVMNNQTGNQSFIEEQVSMILSYADDVIDASSYNDSEKGVVRHQIIDFADDGILKKLIIDNNQESELLSSEKDYKLTKNKDTSLALEKIKFRIKNLINKVMSSVDKNEDLFKKNNIVNLLSNKRVHNRSENLISVLDNVAPYIEKDEHRKNESKNNDFAINGDLGTDYYEESDVNTSLSENVLQGDKLINTEVDALKSSNSEQSVPINTLKVKEETALESNEKNSNSWVDRISQNVEMGNVKDSKQDLNSAESEKIKFHTSKFEKKMKFEEKLFKERQKNNENKREI